MEHFFSQYELAQSMGLTTEQFIDVWKAQTVRRQQTEDNSSDMQTLGGDLFQHQSSQNHQLYEGLTHELHRNFQYLLSQQEQQWQQMHMRLDQMMMEFRSSFEGLSKLISNITELNTDSIKKHFRDELGLLKQDIMEVVKTNHIGSEAGHSSSELLLSFRQGAKAQVKAPHKASRFGNIDIDTYMNINNHSDNILKDVITQSSTETFSSVRPFHNHVSEISQSQQKASYNVAIKSAIAADTLIQKDIHQDTSELSFDQFSQRQHTKLYTGTQQGAIVANRTLEKDVRQITSKLGLDKSQQNASFNAAVKGSVAAKRTLGNDIHLDVSDLSFDKLSQSCQSMSYTSTLQGAVAANRTLEKVIHQETSELCFDHLSQNQQNTSYTATTTGTIAGNGTLGRDVHTESSELSFDLLSQSHQNTSYTTTVRDAVALNTKLGKEAHQDAAMKSYAKIVKQRDNSLATEATDPVKLSSRPADSPSLTMLSESIEATGSYAEAVSHQLRQLRSSPASSISDRCRSDSLNSLRNSNSSLSVKNDSSLSAVIVDSGQQMFTIHNSQQFSVSGKPFLSEIMYSCGEPCRARVRINIDASGVLAVRVHISRGVYDDKHKWPLWLSGFGYLWNITSRRRTQIWQLHPVLCQKPVAEKETVFTADVCLTTLRGSYPKIKYQKLVDKHYAEDNRLTFIWDLQADIIGQSTADKKLR